MNINATFNSSPLKKKRMKEKKKKTPIFKGTLLNSYFKNVAKRAMNENFRRALQKAGATVSLWQLFTAKLFRRPLYITRYLNY